MPAHLGMRKEFKPFNQLLITITYLALDEIAYGPLLWVIDTVLKMCKSVEVGLTCTYYRLRTNKRRTKVNHHWKYRTTGKSR